MFHDKPKKIVPCFYGHFTIWVNHDMHIYVTGHTGMLGELLASDTKVAIYPPMQSAAKGCDLCLLQYQVEGIKVVNYLAN